MFLKKLSVIGFKNIGQAAVDFTSRLNCFVGDNGAGKTNLLDAIHYLSMCKSALAMTDNQNVRHGDEFFVLDGEYSSSENRRENVVCSFKRSAGKIVKHNGNEYTRLADHIGIIPLVMISPADSFLITDAADERRRYLNSFISQLDREYLSAIMRYNHFLSERNTLLKSDSGKLRSPEIMEVVDSRLIHEGGKVHATRKQVIERLAPLVASYYGALSGDREQVELSYRSELNDTSFADLLSQSYEKDRLTQFTNSGIHRDDMLMKIGGHPLRKYGSQGQQKSFLIALKLAQYVIVAEEKSENPILLLDDLFDKLDLQRVEKLIKLVSGNGFGQVFIADCNKLRLENILERSGEDYSLFNVERGDIVRL